MEMDWLVKLEDGTFWGPIHADAMKEHMRQGELKESLPVFMRVPSIDEGKAVRDENDRLRIQLEDLRKDFTSRILNLEAEIEKLTAEHRLTLSDLSTRDLDFDAERQAFAAERSRLEAEQKVLSAEKIKLQAELAKAEKRVEVLSAQAQDSETRNRAREIDLARISELEKRLQAAQAEAKALNTKLENQAADFRREKKKLEVDFLKDVEELKKKLRDSAAYGDLVKAKQPREEQIRRLYTQLGSLLGQGSEPILDADAVIVE